MACWRCCLSHLLLVTLSFWCMRCLCSNFLDPLSTATSLGLLPPASALASVALDGPPGVSPPLCSGLPGTSVSWSAGAPGPSSVSSAPQPLSWPSTPAPVQDGLTLSPATQPFPQKLVDKIRAGRFVEMSELLTDNIKLRQELESIQGFTPFSLLPGFPKPRLRDVSTISSWVYCFLGFMAAATSDLATRDQLAYARIVMREAQRHGGMGWLDYDRGFRQQAAGDRSIRWNTINTNLQASTMVGQNSNPGFQPVFCSLCREVGHVRSQCALACINQPLLPLGTSQTAETGSWQGRPRRRPESRQGICISWNKGACIYPGSCSYRHICATCFRSHRAKDCPDSPAGSQYKPHSGPGRRRPVPASVDK